MLPGIAYYLSRWYPKRELAFRLAMYLGEYGVRGGRGSDVSNWLCLHSLFAVGWRLWRSLGVWNLEDWVDRNRENMGA